MVGLRESIDKAKAGQQGQVIGVSWHVFRGQLRKYNLGCAFKAHLQNHLLGMSLSCYSACKLAYAVASRVTFVCFNGYRLQMLKQRLNRHCYWLYLERYKPLTWITPYIPWI